MGVLGVAAVPQVLYVIPDDFLTRTDTWHKSFPVFVSAGRKEEVMDRRTDGPTDGPTHPLIKSWLTTKMKRNAIKKFFFGLARGTLYSVRQHREVLFYSISETKYVTSKSAAKSQLHLYWSWIQFVSLYLFQH